MFAGSLVPIIPALQVLHLGNSQTLRATWCTTRSLVSVPSLGQTDYLVLCEHNECSDQLQNVISSPGISKCAKSQIFIGSPFQQVPALL